MAMNTQLIYQSGQKVEIDGWYEVVAVKAPTVFQLTVDELFPDYDGRAVCWHLVKQVERPNLSELDSTTGQVARVG